MASTYREKLLRAASLCAILLGISVGLCGLTGMAAIAGRQTPHSLLVAMGVAELVTAALSFLGLIVSGLLLFVHFLLQRGQQQ